MKKHKSLSDSQDERELAALMIKAQGGDGQAYDQLLLRIEKMLQSFVKKSVPADMADDVIQEIILGVHAKRGTYSPERFFLPWFYAIARYKVIDFIRSRTRRNMLSFGSEDFDRLMTTDVEGVIDHLKVDDLEGLLESLPEKQKEIIKLVKIEGLSIKEAALKTGLSESNIKVSVHRALNTLKSKFQGERR